ncbi:MAG: RCC1 domain-containing protein [Microthrixaceae bacterium]
MALALGLALVAAACIPANVGDPCDFTSDLGYDDTHILNCQNGRYARYVTKEVALAWWAVVLEAEQQDQGGGGGAPPPAPPTGPPPAGNPITVRKVVTGNAHSCALLSHGRVKCWGNNNVGQLGITPGGAHNVPILLSTITTAIDITAGSNHNCVILHDRRAACWGSNVLGQLGHASLINSDKPLLIDGLANITSISASIGGPTAGSGHTCVVYNGDHRVACWGAGSSGQLGNDTIISSASPV